MMRRLRDWAHGVWTNPRRRRLEKLINDEDVKVEISNPAYTIWPGRIHMKFVRIYVNGETQFMLEGHDLFASISVHELFKRRMHVTKLASHHVRYQMRVQVKDPKGIEKRLAAYPPLEGLPGANVLHEKKADKAESRDPEWT